MKNGNGKFFSNQIELSPSDDLSQIKSVFDSFCMKNVTETVENIKIEQITMVSHNVL